MGPPGSGKGTQGALLSRRLGVPHVASGDLLRAALAEAPDSEIGRAARVIVGGEMVSDAVAGALVFGAMDAGGASGWVLDGYPRTVAQAQALEDWCRRRGTAIDHVVLLEAPRDAIVSRLRGRSREDDSPEGIGLRLDRYAARTAPVLAFYEGRGLLRRIDATGDPEAVASRICAVVPSLI